jgi:ribose transport system permease protein
MVGVGRLAGLLSFVAPALGLAVAALVFYAIPPHAAVTLLDVRTIALHTVIVGTAALGVTLIIISGGIDLSIGSAVALASVTAALVAARGGSPVASLLVAIATGGACGLYNGLLITGLRLPPFIATLGTLGFFRGVSKWVAASRPISASPGWLENWVRIEPTRSWLLLAPVVLVMLLLSILTAAMLRYTVFGRRIVAIGSNEEAARRAGIPIARTKIMVYVTGGLFIGLAGLVQFARLQQGDPTVAVGLELDVIAAVVIGGASLSGGHGSIAGTIAGAALMAFLKNRCTVLGWPNFVQEMAVGHIIIGAVAIDRWRKSRG